MNKILIVKDDRGIAKNLSFLLSGEEYAFAVASDQKTALERLKAERFDLILPDISLPDGNGYSACTAAKSISDIPLIFLTASDDEASVVTRLDLGADNYIVKPFRPMELISRIKSVLRRSGKVESVFEIGSVKIDAIRGTVHKNGAELFLSALEYRLLLMFVNNCGMTLTRDKLLSDIWDISGKFVNDNTLTVYIKRLREKLRTIRKIHPF